MLDADVEVLDAPELATAIKERGDRYRAAERFDERWTLTLPIGLRWAAPTCGGG
jgi:hypothetical protein